MTAELKAAPRADRSSTPIDFPTPLLRLVDQAVEAALPSNQTALAAIGDPDALIWIGRALSVQEGTLIEAVIVEIARQRSEHLVITGLKLPILQEAINLVSRHHADQVHDLTVDPQAKAVQTYFPDLVIVHQADRYGIVIDIKRSLGGYLNSGKLQELQLKMAASALGLPDILWHQHKRTSINRVGTAIVDASRKVDDIDNGLWSLGGLDRLLGCAGAGASAEYAISLFRAKIRERWRLTIEHGQQQRPVTHSDAVEIVTKLAKGQGVADTRPLTVTLFRPGSAVH